MPPPSSVPGSSRQRPTVRVPGQERHTAPAMKQKEKHSSKGYSTKHLIHGLSTEKMSKMAYKPIEELVNVECRLMYIRPGKMMKQLVGVSMHHS